MLAYEININFFTRMPFYSKWIPIKNQESPNSKPDTHPSYGQHGY